MCGPERILIIWKGIILTLCVCVCGCVTCVLLSMSVKNLDFVKQAHMGNLSFCGF